jgi:hypothetical protein
LHPENYSKDEKDKVIPKLQSIMALVRKARR